ncbi:hypothetical protein BGZ88_012552, partial [Linnemannia elongata]
MLRLRAGSVQSLQGGLSAQSSAYTLASPTRSLPWHNPSVTLEIHQGSEEDRSPTLASPPPAFHRAFPPPPTG